MARAWRLRAEAARAEGYTYVHALVNEGREAGGSLPHTHSQLVWLHAVPPVPAAEDNLAALLDGPEVLERDGVAVVCAPAGRLPYELVVAPRQPEADAFRSELLGPALALAAEAVRRLRRLEPSLPLNLWLHDAGRWHLEVVPRLSVLAGLELGAGIYVNTLAPEEAAERLRSAS